MPILKRFWLTLSFILVPAVSLAFMTPAGRVVRNQPWRLSREGAFHSEGTLRFATFSANYSLNWISPGNYEVIISGLPKNLYSSESLASSEWKIVRKQGKCMVKTSTQTLSCGGPGLWGTIELSGRAESVVEALLQADLITKEMAADPVVDSKDPLTLKIDPRQKIAIGKNHGLPTAFIQITGSRVNRDAKENIYPVIQYDQTFLAPRLLRVKTDNGILSVEANGNLDVERETPRSSFILSDKLVVKNQKDQQITISRKEPASLSSKHPLILEKTPYDLAVLSDALTYDGQYILNALLFVH